MVVEFGEENEDIEARAGLRL